MNYRVKLTDYTRVKEYNYESAELLYVEGNSAKLKFNDGKVINVLKKRLIDVETSKKSINKYKNEIEIGDWVRTNGDGNTSCDLIIEGRVGAKNPNGFYIFQNKYEGDSGSINSVDYGFAYSWFIEFNNDKASIEVITASPNNPTVRCTHCAKRKSIIDIVKVGDEKWCFDCIVKSGVKCEHCNSFIKQTEVKNFSSKQYCVDCYNKLVVKCAGCHTTHFKESIKHSKTDNAYYCNPCFKTRFAVCLGCKREMIRNKERIFEGADHNLYCAQCFSERFSNCSQCGKLCWHEDLRHHDGETVFYCTQCWRQFAVIKDYRYTPPLSFRKMDWETNPLFFGIELEVETPPKEAPEDIAIKFTKFLKQKGIDDCFYLKRDGSVDGFEIVSHPISLQYFHNSFNVKEMLSWLRERKCTSFDNTHCGLHIHINKKFFQVIDIVKLRLFFKLNEKQILDFSQRHGKGLQFCKTEPASVREILRNVPQNGRHWSLNINTIGRQTVEFRPFRGTLRHERLIASLQFADALAHFIKTIGVSSIYHDTKQKDSWKTFTDWCKKQGSYDHLCKLMRMGKLKK